LSFSETPSLDDSFFEKLGQLKKDTDHFLNSECEKFRDESAYPHPLHEGIRYSLFSDGKRIRPCLMLMSAELFECPKEAVLPFAGALELIHAYSLVHDDLPCMDGDEERRGKPSAWKAYGEANAVLIGDALLSEAFALIHRSLSSSRFQNEESLSLRGSFEALRRFSKRIGRKGMLLGQSLDVHIEKTPLQTEAMSEIKNIELQTQDEKLDFLTHLHALKTGELFSLAAEIPPLLVGKNNEAELMSVFGSRLGLLFQAVDDFEDLGEDAEALNIIDCLKEGEAKPFIEHLVSEALQNITSFGDKGKPIRQMVAWVARRALKT
jgi:geranylgeranyl pyrophosphate synthase